MANLAQQAVDYSNTVGACLSVEGCVGITVWDFYDPVSSSLLHLCKQCANYFSFPGCLECLPDMAQLICGLQTSPSILLTTVSWTR
jgi:hypothetical protein